MRISDGSSDVCSSDLFTPSGNSEIDKLLGGGLERGTNALFIGAAGVGKSSLALTFALAAAGRGEHAVFFAFDAGRGTLEARARTIGQPLDEALASGNLRIQQIDQIGRAHVRPQVTNANLVCRLLLEKKTPHHKR